MSSTAVQAHPGQVPFYQNSSSAFPLRAMSADTDVVTVFPEYLGIPFDTFAASASPSLTDPWTVQMIALANLAKSAGKPLMVEIVLVRDAVVARAINQNGQLVIQAGWAPACTDFTQAAYSNFEKAYVNYAAWMAKLFSPKYMVIMVEANLYYTHCGGNTASWRSIIDTEIRAYNAVKAVDPATVAFPSFKLEDLYGQTLAGFDQIQYAALASMKRDRLGLATYPNSIPAGKGFINPYQLPLDYFARIRDRNPTEPRIVITETGWNSAGLSVLYQGSCFTNFVYSEPSFQAAFLNLLLYSAYVDNFDLITWWSDRDLIPSTVMSTCFPVSSPPYPECNGDMWCAAVNSWRSAPTGWTPAFAELAFKSFGTLGLRQYDGTANPLTLALWQRFLALPIFPPK